MPGIINHWGNISQNHNEVPPHTYDCNFKKQIRSVVEEVEKLDYSYVIKVKPL